MKFLRYAIQYISQGYTIHRSGPERKTTLPRDVAAWVCASKLHGVSAVTKITQDIFVSMDLSLNYTQW